MFLTIVGIAIVFALFVAPAVAAVRHGSDSRRDDSLHGSLVSSDYATPVHGFWR